MCLPMSGSQVFFSWWWFCQAYLGSTGLDLRLWVRFRCALLGSRSPGTLLLRNILMVMAEIQEGKLSQVSTCTVLACIMSDHTSLTKASHMTNVNGMCPRVNGMEMSTHPILLGGSSEVHSKGHGYKIPSQGRLKGWPQRHKPNNSPHLWGSLSD